MTMTPDSIPETPSSARLVRATLLSMAVAAAVLVIVVLPAEYGLDPLGTGRALGIYRPPAVTVVPAQSGVAGADGGEVGGAGARAFDTPMRSDEMSVTLRPGQGIEIKAEMRRGETFVYSWSATGPVDVDMHGDAADPAEGEYLGYGKAELQTGASGSFVAPVTGNHGWFWQNVQWEPVTITVKTSGFYRRVFQP